MVGYWVSILNTSIHVINVFLIYNIFLLVAITTLLESANDRDDNVRDTVVTSLRRLARKYPAEVLQNASAYRQKNLKVNIMLF